jgi:hypothetical protein
MPWNISGRYAETCNCDYLCPCVPSAMAKTTHGYCIFAAGYEIERGEFDGLALDGRKFVLVVHTPSAMNEGNWKAGLIVDDQADARQQDAITAIATGQAGGPMANLAPLIGEFAGVEKRPITIDESNGRWSVKAGDAVDEELVGASSLGGEQMYLDNTGHPANNRLALATATKSHLHAFGIDWDQEDGRNNGHFAPFDWRG